VLLRRLIEIEALLSCRSTLPPGSKCLLTLNCR